MMSVYRNGVPFEPAAKCLEFWKLKEQKAQCRDSSIRFIISSASRRPLIKAPWTVAKSTSYQRGLYWLGTTHDYYSYAHQQNVGQLLDYSR